MKNKEVLFFVTNAYIDKKRNQNFDHNLTAARQNFRVGEYDLAIQDIKRYFKIPTSISLKVQKMSLEDCVGAQIILPGYLFLKDYKAVMNREYCIQINNTSFKDFSVFAKSIIHEIAHLKLFIDGVTGKTIKGPHKQYWMEEKAVDTLAILYGFADIYMEAFSVFNYDRNETYINNEEMLFLYSCLKDNKQFKRTKRKWYKKLFSKIQSL